MTGWSEWVDARDRDQRVTDDDMTAAGSSIG
jgi:hypothetical protein